MINTARSLCISLIVLPGIVLAQPNPVASAVRTMAEPSGRHLLQAAEAMPAERYTFRPTPAQMTFGEIILHIRRDNRTTCGALSGLVPPVERDPVATDGKATLVAALGRSLTFCHSALERVEDSHLADKVTWYGHGTTRATPALGVLTDWADHYGQLAIYLRLNGILPPTASPAPKAAPSTSTNAPHDFDFEIGAWTVANSRLLHRPDGSTEWIHFPGTSVARPVWSGDGDVVELESDAPSGHSKALIVRLFDPRQRQWRITFASAGDGVVGPPLVGAFSGGRGEFQGADEVDGKPVLIRHVLSRVTPTGYLLEQSMSRDSGQTWEVNWISEHVRTGS